jgi:hypothetical protein
MFLKRLLSHLRARARPFAVIDNYNTKNLPQTVQITPDYSSALQCLTLSAISLKRL